MCQITFDDSINIEYLTRVLHDHGFELTQNGKLKFTMIHKGCWHEGCDRKVVTVNFDGRPLCSKHGLDALKRATHALRFSLT